MPRIDSYGSPAGGVAGTDVVPIWDTSAAAVKDVTVDDIAGYVGAGGTSSDFYTPEAYGAAGDGSTNDTSAIQAMLDALELTGGTAMFTRGKTYRTTGVTFTSPARKAVIAGYGATLQATTTAIAGPLLTVHDGLGRTVVEGLEFEGGAGNTTTIGLRSLNSRRLATFDVRYNNLGGGLQLYNDGAADADPYNEDCNFNRGAVNACTVAIEMAKSADVSTTDSFAGCKFRDIVISNCATHFRVGDDCNFYRGRVEGLTHFFGQTTGHIVGYDIRGRVGGTIIDVAAEGTAANTDNQFMTLAATALRTNTLRVRATLTNARFIVPYIEDFTTNGPPAADWTIQETVSTPWTTVGGSGGLLGFYGKTTPIAQQVGVPKTVEALHDALTALGLLAPVTYVTVTESFNKADADTLGPTLTWTETSGDLDVVSNQAKGTGTFGEARAGTAMGTYDQYAQVAAYKNGATTTANYVQVQARGLDSARTHYIVRLLANNTYQMYRRVAGATTSIGSGSVTWADGDTLRIEVQGSTIRGMLNGVTFGTVTDTTLTAGLFVGFGIGGTVCTADSFAAGDFY